MTLLITVIAAVITTVLWYNRKNNDMQLHVLMFMFWGAESFNQPLNNWDLSNEPSGAKELEKFRQLKGQGGEQKESKK